MYLSIIIPVRNEAGNLPELHRRVSDTCKSLRKPFEIIYIENASEDNSLEVLRSLKGAKVIVLRWMSYMRKAQSLAMDAGFKAAKGENIIYIDADLQIEPEVIPEFLSKLEEGYDVVCGWRIPTDELLKSDLSRALKSPLRRIYTFFRRRLIDEGVHDPGSAIKAFKKEALVEVDLYGEMHRFLIAMLHWQGYKITELKVNQYPRKHGRSNYNLFKGFQGFTDLLNIFIWRKYADRPLHLFGVSGIIIFTFGILFLAILLVLRTFKLIMLSQSIFPVLAVLTIITGLQLFLSGVVADSLARLMYAQSKIAPYKVREVIEN